MEAELIFRQQGLRHPNLRTALAGSDFHARRLHQKALFYRLPGRPLIKWCYMMFPARRDARRRGRHYLCHAPVHL